MQFCRFAFSFSVRKRSRLSQVHKNLSLVFQFPAIGGKVNTNFIPADLVVPNKVLGELMEDDARELTITITNDNSEIPASISDISIKFCEEDEAERKD